jgi:hypothetical protein
VARRHGHLRPGPQGRTAGRPARQGRSIDALHRICDRLTFTAGLSISIVPYNRGGLVRRSMCLGRRQVVDANVRIYVQEVWAVHTAASDGGMRTAVRVPRMRRACPPCPPDRTKLPYRVGRNASGRRKVRAYHRRIARTAAILARSCWIDQEVETCPESPSESFSARLTDLASRDPANFPHADPISVKSMAPACNAAPGQEFLYRTPGPVPR